MNKYPKYIKDCDLCGKPVVAKNSGLDKRNRKFCSKSCNAIVNNKNKVWTDEQRKKVGSRILKHGRGYEKLFKVWDSMKRRCYLEKDQSYKNYGARGIKICKEWVSNYETFRAWALDNCYKEGLSIERVDNNKEYSPENCKFIIKSEQSKNRRPFKEWNKVK